MSLVIGLQRHPGIDVDGALPHIQYWANRVSVAWNTPAVEIKAYNKRKPRGSWPVRWSDKLPADAGGIHLDSKGHPYALVRPSEGLVAATHELFEMMVDPLGDRFTTLGDTDYLVEVCDPVEARSDQQGVSDFVLPAWYLPEDVENPPTSRLSPQPRPHELVAGGYVSYIIGGYWWQSYRTMLGQVHSILLGPANERTRSEKDRLAAKRAA